MRFVHDVYIYYALELFVCNRDTFDLAVCEAAFEFKRNQNNLRGVDDENEFVDIVVSVCAGGRRSNIRLRLGESE